MANKSISKKVQEYEKVCREKFVHYLGNRYQKILVPKDQFSPIDLLCIHKEGDTHLFELKHTDRYFVDDFPEAMIDVKKWNTLVKLTEENDYVFYMRMYKDGYAVWHINSLTDKDYFVADLERKAVTASNSSKTKKKCILIYLTSALYIHREPRFLPNGHQIQRISMDELQKLNKK